MLSDYGERQYGLNGEFVANRYTFYSFSRRHFKTSDSQYFIPRVFPAYLYNNDIDR